MLGLVRHPEQGASKLFDQRVPRQMAELEGLAASIGFEVDDLAMILMAMRVGASQNVRARIDISPYDATTRVRFAKEFSRLFDAKLGGRGHSPVFGLSCLFQVLEGRPDASDTERDILERTVRSTYRSFPERDVVVGTDSGEEFVGRVLKIGRTNEFVDRRAYYEQFYPELSTRPMDRGTLPVREHVVVLQGTEEAHAIDLDQLASLEIVRN